MAHELRSYGLDALIVDWSRDDLPKAIRELAQDEEIQRKLAVMQTSYRRFHSIDNLAARLEACIA
jgi:esterase/lipase superfamily enzyme